ncbi:trypsin-like peptidase domain-containing protein [Nocardioides sp. zg-536]|uniref:Trypsin-like peptidase domain-containing protein n=1 Tax=Nocardioides faecalis TaxID=2803858 RepID=A0A939BSL7_9ACTN|nr:trypsin-like peptidase domain-containing protein [Nocardioides faecalis]MBM9459759.1 trypsin-like peptidase domain-containing protein [Nocardioides faecalis]MBS4753464.1 trypsin-like peptidase domain-containing protein [Nocardioides faecalis]QVI58274.1 trypsin-like peptidase domain-containing protein [Nocardioides faecalis]
MTQSMPPVPPSQPGRSTLPPPPPYAPGGAGPTGFSPAPSPSTRPRRGTFAALVLTGALLVGGGAGIGGAAIYDAANDDTTSSAGTSLPVVDSGKQAAADGSVESVAETVLPSVVALSVTGNGGSGSGSGAVLDSDGLILTNDHVLTLGGEIDAKDAQVVVSFNDGTKKRAEVVGTDPLTDTALVKVDGAEDLKPITIGKSSNLTVGQEVVAIGSPFGLESTVTSGIVSALNRPVQVARDANGNTTAYPAIQTDAAINPGNSGGPLVNMEGQLVGINASIRSASNGQGSAGSIGLGFAIPIDSVLPIIEQMRAGEAPTHARLGIQVSNAASDPRSGQNSSDPTADGARIESAEQGSAATDAGLRAGDVITAVDGIRIEDAESLIATVRSFRPGDTVKVTYLRGGKEGTTELKLGSDG